MPISTTACRTYVWNADYKRLYRPHNGPKGAGLISLQSFRPWASHWGGWQGGNRGPSKLKENLMHKINTNGKRQCTSEPNISPDVVSRAKEIMWWGGKGYLDIDAAQNRESERWKLAVSVQYSLGIGALSLSDLSNQVTGELVNMGRRVTNAPGWGEVPFNISRLAWIWFYIHQAMFRLIVSLPGFLILGGKCSGGKHESSGHWNAILCTENEYIGVWLISQ